VVFPLCQRGMSRSDRGIWLNWLVFVGISIYPNPAEDFITIQTSEVSETSEVYKVQIFDVLGIEVISTPSLRDTPQEGNLRIDVSHLPSGIYYIKIGEKVEKFVKM